MWKRQKCIIFVVKKNVNIPDMEKDVAGVVEEAAVLRTENLVKKYFPEIKFAAVLGQRDAVPVKPDPAIVHDIMQMAGVADTADIIYIGDSLVDLNTAKNSNVEFAAVTWGFCPRESLAENSPAHIADNIEELRVILL